MAEWHSRSTRRSPVANRLAGGIDEFFSRTDATGAFSPLTDALGSTVALTDSTGAVQTQYTYEPFGNTTIGGPGNANPYQYTGRDNDGTGLYYYRARYYSPTYQRFISEDPLRFAGGGPGGEVGEGTVLDLAVLAEGFAEGGRRGIAVGNGGDVDDFCISHPRHRAKNNIHYT